MKTYVAFCPHFHQPHFQLHHVREEVFRNSYLPWIDLLEQSAFHPGFHINLHFSGPLLVWLDQEKPEYLERLRKLLALPGVGLIGGTADEAFAQLSSRPDDIYYQVREYARLTTRHLGVEAWDWEGIHVVEREAGEWTLYHLALAARATGAWPLVYLDAETFYEPHFNYPGGPFDYCRRHFGFDDPHARTTVSHLPPEILFYGLRDEIGGQDFFVLPVHSQFRYRLLKRRPFSPGDRTFFSPGQYLFYLKDAGDKARETARRLGKRMEPVVVIFEDAEKFGQWSKDPDGDTAWLKELFRLIIEDEELEFTGLRSYLATQGYLDTYPVASSRSYAEWENWTARRGIRGVTFGDERLRRVISRQRDLEQKIGSLEQLLLQGMAGGYLSPGLLAEAVFASPHRVRLIEEILSTSHPAELGRAYDVVQRVRNLAYQEDPRWASRHPSYGSCAYFDLQALAFLDLAERLTDQMMERVRPTGDVLPEVTLRDWDMDGEEEVVILTVRQHVVIHIRKGLVLFHQVLGEGPASFASRLEYLEQEMQGPKSYSDVLSASYPLVFTETDSSLREEFYPQGGRVERCRNSMGVEFFVLRDDDSLVGLRHDTEGYRLLNMERQGDEVKVSLESTGFLTDGSRCWHYRVTKIFVIKESALELAVAAEVDSAESETLIYMMPELVTSAVPSDERELKPCSWLGIEGDDDVIFYEIARGSRHDQLNDAKETVMLPGPRSLTYVFEFNNGLGKKSQGSVSWAIQASPAVSRVIIEPAVRCYYSGHVFPEQSRLGYDSSGLLVRPGVGVTNGYADFKAELRWQLDGMREPNQFRHVIRLL